MGYVVGWLGFRAAEFPSGADDRLRAALAAFHRCLELVQRHREPAAGGRRHSRTCSAPRRCIDEAAQIVAIGWALWIEWFATRQALGTGGLVAVLLVVLDQLIGLLLAGLNLTLLS